MYIEIYTCINVSMYTLTSESDTDRYAREEKVELVSPSAAVFLLFVDGVKDVHDVRVLHERRSINDVARRRRLDDANVARICRRRGDRLCCELEPGKVCLRDKLWRGSVPQCDQMFK